MERVKLFSFSSVYCHNLYILLSVVNWTQLLWNLWNDSCWKTRMERNYALGKHWIFSRFCMYWPFYSCLFQETYPKKLNFPKKKNFIESNNINAGNWIFFFLDAIEFYWAGTRFELLIRQWKPIAWYIG